MALALVCVCAQICRICQIHWVGPELGPVASLVLLLLRLLSRLFT